MIPRQTCIYMQVNIFVARRPWLYSAHEEGIFGIIALLPGAPSNHYVLTAGEKFLWRSLALQLVQNRTLCLAAKVKQYWAAIAK